jgi:TonB family protein
VTFLALTLAVVIAGSEVQLGTQNPGTAPDLSAAKNLYASGDYEEALKKLPTDRNVDEADQYRALCLLALGKTDEAQRALEALVTRRPLFKMSEADFSPRLVSMFREVRKRVLPVTVRELYVKARANFDQKNYDAASAELKDLMALFGDDDLAEASASLADLKLVSEGFLTLTQTELANRAKAQAAAAPPDPGPAVAPAKLIYTADDKDVKPPVEVSREMPEWRPGSAIADQQEHRGILRIVIDERGKVESAMIVQSVQTSYDPQLLDAAKRWQYRPALRNGQAVKYVKLISITLSSR